MNATDKPLASEDKWQIELERAIDSHGGNDVVVPYRQVALAFPSTQPNPRSFHDRLVDQDRLKKWAATRRWQVKLAPEMAQPDSDDLPPVRFIKIT